MAAKPATAWWKHCWVGLLWMAHGAWATTEFSYDPATEEQFRYIVPADSNYGGSKPTRDLQTGAIWLVPDPRSAAGQAKSAGRMVYSQRIQFLDSAGTPASFSTSFTFQIITTANYGHSGEGMAFFIARDLQFPLNSAGGYLGLENSTDEALPLFAVEFDTLQSTDIPELADPSSSHVGIDIAGLKSALTYDASNSSDDLFLYGNAILQARVDFNASSRVTQVRMLNPAASPALRLVLELSTTDISQVFDTYMYVGITATSARTNTSGYAIYSWNFSSSLGVDGKILSPAPALAPSSVAPPIMSPAHSFPDPASPASSSDIRRPKKKSVTPVVLAISLPLVMLCVLGMLAAYLCGSPACRMLAPSRAEHPLDPSLPARFSYGDLKRATKGFSDKMLLGQGGFSHVYKGVLPFDGSLVAVKKLNDGLGEEVSFSAEVSIISSIRHRHLLQLRGWCYEKGKALMVYPYMKNGSLEKYLYRNHENERGASVLSSETRLRILVGVAKGLEYLHGGLRECVLHRDVKAANVLLDDDFEPMLGDFGLARLITHDKMVTMTAAGTMGYVAPEVVYTGKATDRADVYSFGILALEVACGRRVLDVKLQAQEMNLLEWVWMLQNSDMLMDALDSRMLHQLAAAHDEEGMMSGAEAADIGLHDLELWRSVLHLALACCHPQPGCRPSMRQVQQVLKEGLILPLTISRPKARFPSPNMHHHFANALSSSESSVSVEQVPVARPV